MYRTEALVLKGYDYAEADRILTLYTPRSGKLRVIAKGVRRTKSRKAGHLDLFTRSTLLVARGRQLDIVTQAETIEAFRPMREDLWRVSYGHYVAELIDAFSVEQLANVPLYGAAVATFRRLAESPNLDVTVRAFEMQLLSLSGYQAQLHRCLQCRAQILPEINRFSAKMGGILCPRCAAADAAAPAISVNALKVLRNLQTNEHAMLSLPDMPEDVQREIEQRMHEYIVYRLENRPRSIKFIEHLRAEGATP